MNRKDILILLSPCIAFLLVAAAAFGVSRTLAQSTTEDHRADEKFRDLSVKVKTGVLRPTPDEMLEAVRRYHATAQAEGALMGSASKLVRSIACLVPGGIFWQVAAVLSVVKRRRKISADISPA